MLLLVKLPLQYITRTKRKIDNTVKWSFPGSQTVTSPESDCKEIIPSPVTAPTRRVQIGAKLKHKPTRRTVKGNRPLPHSLTTAHYSHTRRLSFQNYQLITNLIIPRAL